MDTRMVAAGMDIGGVKGDLEEGVSVGEEVMLRYFRSSNQSWESYTGNSYCMDFRSVS
jgi:hypothetical protein